jgi:hypothetical protein
MSDTQLEWVWELREFIADARRKASMMRRARAAEHSALNPEVLADYLEEFANDLEAKLNSALEGRRC